MVQYYFKVTIRRACFAAISAWPDRMPREVTTAVTKKHIMSRAHSLTLSACFSSSSRFAACGTSRAICKNSSWRMLPGAAANMEKKRSANSAAGMTPVLQAANKIKHHRHTQQHDAVRYVAGLACSYGAYQPLGGESPPVDLSCTLSSEASCLLPT